jgi:curved DNA-binding protein CbpA
MDPYLVLGVARDCTLPEVKKTFRAKVRLEHPDRGGEERKFIRICTAYRMILSERDSADDSDSSVQAASNRGRPAPRDAKYDHQNLVDLMLQVSARSAAGKTYSRSRQVGSASGTQENSGAAIGGMIAVAIIIAELWAVFVIGGLLR